MLSNLHADTRQSDIDRDCGAYITECHCGMAVEACELNEEGDCQQCELDKFNQEFKEEKTEK